MKNEYITQFTVQDFVNGWRLAATMNGIESIDKVLQYFNLSEYNDVDEATLNKSKIAIYVNAYFAYERNNEGIDGTLFKVVEAGRFLNLSRLVIDNLGELYLQTDDPGFVPSDKHLRYAAEARNRYSLESSDDKRLLKSHTFNYIHEFTKVRDFLVKKGQEKLERAAVVLSIEVVKMEY